MSFIPTLLLASLLGCGGDAPPQPPAEKAAKAGKAGKVRQQGGDLSSKITAAKKKLVVEGQLPTARKLRRISELEEGEPALVIFVVLDTLRADHTQLCGYDKPNTPVLSTLVEMGAKWTCDAYSPATWTLPAHASYFTGKTTSEHGVHTLGTPLSEDYETLAEVYAERGYQTMLVSANPVFAKEAGGFWQGFDRTLSARDLVSPLRGGSFGPIVDSEMAKVSPDHPLFLFVNIFDAHDPYPAVPAGIPWADPQKKVDLHPHTADENNPYYAFVTKQMEEGRIEPYLGDITNSYDHAISVADRNLGELMKVLKRRGWLKRPHRAVVTSDHGEHLGEHGLLRHGSATWQTVTRVPLMYFTGKGNPTVELPSPVNVSVVHSLLLDGKLPDEPMLVESASGHNKDDFKPSWKTVAVWKDNAEKLQFFDGEFRRFDLSADPMEDKPLALDESHPLFSTLRDRVAAHEESIAKALEIGADPDLMEALKAVGYVQDDE